MFLNFLIRINKEKLNKMITSKSNYDKILKQSQKLDKLINIWVKKHLNFASKK